MENLTKHAGLVALILSAIALWVAVGGNVTFFGGTTNFDDLSLGDGLVVNEDSGSAAVSDSRFESDTDTHAFFLDASTDRVGLGSSTPTTDLSIGGAGATSTISGGFFCALFEDEAGRDIWVTLATSGNTVFATSTTACN